MNRIIEIFEDKGLVNRIQKRLPYLFQLAEIDCSRANKIGMEVGSLRERILTSLLINTFGQENVQTEIPITEPETDVKLFGQAISIKTITGWGGVKMIWTVDPIKAKEFLATYSPKCGILLVQISWGNTGGFYFIPLSAQKRVFMELGRKKYIKLPKEGTNPRGVEISKEALLRLVKEPDTKHIEINWQRSQINYSAYERWLNYWKDEGQNYDTKNKQATL